MSFASDAMVRTIEPGFLAPADGNHSPGVAPASLPVDFAAAAASASSQRDVGAIISTGVQFVLFLRWLHRRMRNDEITRAFVRDIATNHLPHTYNALQKIAAQQGIELDETPLVRFVDLNGHCHTR